MMTNETWQFKIDPETRNDPLLQCLIALTQINHKPFTAKSLTAGLPLEQGKLTPDLFPRAAKRAGLSARLVKYELNTLTQQLLPAVVLLNDEHVCIATRVKKDKIEVLQPETGLGVKEFNVDELESQYTGYSFFVSPMYQFSQRSEEVAPDTHKNWFTRAIAKVWPIYSEIFLASFLINVFALASPLFIMNVYDRVVPNSATETLWALAIGMGIVIIFDLVMRTLRGYFIDTAAKKIDTELSSSIFEQLLGMQCAARPRSVGVLANSVHMFENFRDFITSASISAFIDLPFVALFLLVIWYVGGAVVWVPLIAIPLMIAVGYVLQKPLNDLVSEVYKHSSEKHATLIEALHNMETVKTSNAEGPLQRRWEQVVCLAAKLNVKVRLLSNTVLNFAAFTQQFSTVAVVIVGVYIISGGNLTMGGLVACTILTGRALSPMAQVAALLIRYNQTVSSLHSLNTLMEAPTERPEGKAKIHKEKLQGAIEFKKVSFHYPEQSIYAINNISFRVAPGEKVGLVGRIGSGKTTLEKLILNLYQATEGTILVDGTEIQQYDPADLRHNIGYVPQDIELFFGSVKDNIVIGAPYVEDELMLRAAQIAGVNQFVDNHPEGYDRQVGERGMQLSGGQRQALAVARALLLDPPILIMDEPTNLMDDRTEAIFRNSLSENLDNKTLLLITHKASMLQLVDRLIVLDNGCIVADGPKEQVLAALAQGKVRTEAA